MTPHHEDDRDNKQEVDASAERSRKVATALLVHLLADCDISPAYALQGLCRVLAETISVVTGNNTDGTKWLRLSARAMDELTAKPGRLGPAQKSYHAFACQVHEAICREDSIFSGFKPFVMDAPDDVRLLARMAHGLLGDDIRLAMSWAEQRGGQVDPVDALTFNNCEDLNQLNALAFALACVSAGQTAEMNKPGGQA